MSWRRHFLLSILGLTLLMMAGCTSSGPSSSALDVPKAIEINALTPLQELLGGHSVICPSGTPCPDGVGQVLTKYQENGKTMMSVCTGFLISSDLILTNSHCVPDEVKENPSVCPQQIGIKFPASKQIGEESLACGRLLKASEVYATGPMAFLQSDYALIQLEQRTVRTPLRLSRAGIEDKTYYQAITIDPVTTTTLAGEVSLKSCLAIQGSQAFPSFQYFLDPVVSLFGHKDECRIIHGNSGSPLVDEMGVVHGLIQAGSAEQFDHFLAQMVQFGAWKPSSGLTMALASNLACLAGGDEVAALPPLAKICADEKSFHEARVRIINETEKRNDEVLQRQVLKKLQSWWKPSRDIVYRLVPGAISSEGNRMTLPYRVKLVCRRPESQKYSLNELTIQEPVLFLRTQLDAFLRLEVMATDVLTEPQKVDMATFRSLPTCQGTELLWGSELSAVIGPPQ